MKEPNLQADLMEQIAEAMRRNPDGWWREFESWNYAKGGWERCAGLENLHYFMEQLEDKSIRPKPRTYTLHIEDMPEPMREEPEHDQYYWAIDLTYFAFQPEQFAWKDSHPDRNRLNHGNCYPDKESAQQAMDKLKAAMGGAGMTEQSQCWICLECYDDSHHEPGDKYCRVKKRNAELEQVVSDMDQEDIDFVQAHDCGAGMLLAMRDKAIAELQSLAEDREKEITELRAHSKRTMDVLAEVMMRIDDGDLERIPFERVRTIYNEMPEQSLREIRAEAGREGFLDGACEFADDPTTTEARQRIHDLADQYAQQIRSGER